MNRMRTLLAVALMSALAVAAPAAAQAAPDAKPKTGGGYQALGWGWGG